MEGCSKMSNKRLVREIALILVVKVICLMVIKVIWFDSPTIPKGMDNQVAEHITGVVPVAQESSR